MESPSKQPNALAIASLVVGVLAWPLTRCYGLGAPVGLVALVMGLIGLRQIKSDACLQSGQELAIAGAIPGGISTITGVVLILTVGGLALLGPQIDAVFSKINESLLTPYP